MKKKEVEKVLKDIVESTGFINLDINDVNKLKKDSDIIDAIKIRGKK